MRNRKIDRPYPDIDSHYLAEQIRGTIKGGLREVSLLGAIDQWVVNYDLLLDVDKPKLLTAVYDTPPVSITQVDA